MSVAFIFPGQGSQHPNMLHELPKHPEVDRTIKEASYVLGRDALELDTKDALLSTVAVQLALLISGVALARVLRYEDAAPDIVAGHSIGSFSAAVVSGALDFVDAVSLVELRGKLMEQSYPKDYGMGVIVGLDEMRVSILTEQVNSVNDPVYIANINTYDQITIAGRLSAIEKVFALASSMGAHKTKILNVSVPSHCELLSGVSKEIASKLAAISLNNPNTLFVGNCRARVLRNAEDICKDLSDGVANTVRWHDSATLMYERGVRLFIELGPGETLTNMAKKEFKDARCISALNSGIESSCILIKREREK
ncbi:malonate decarboxylase subunit epsilon [Anaeromicropila herbilytica]|uniref:Malonyl CoA-acyl carrier protein transacylase n=1 Tax=Anaeromicropila herbilytica TaxID=2785025 RepID=A0A7R7IEH8_9FIRM|nr:malonate decarboxylase subunit epsilon [Anaeromicropila herbilytica]BCN32662.1 malonyl CoA-acyl carrier protein transacylase [Anaeromicropila herbilytica]